MTAIAAPQPSWNPNAAVARSFGYALALFAVFVFSPDNDVAGIIKVGLTIALLWFGTRYTMQTCRGLSGVVAPGVVAHALRWLIAGFALIVHVFAIFMTAGISIIVIASIFNGPLVG